MARFLAVLFALSGVLSIAKADNELGLMDYCNETCSSLNFPARITSEHYYLNIVTKVNWFKAHQFCILHGMRLATILNEQDNKEMLLLMTANGVGDAWFGLTDLGDEGVFYHMASGALANYTDWLPGKPNNKGFRGGPENCGRIRTWDDGQVGWDEDVCDDPYFFACDLKTR